jgi:hypothetical protein
VQPIKGVATGNAMVVKAYILTPKASIESISFNLSSVKV